MSLDHQSVVAISDIKHFSMTSEVGMNCKFDGVPGHFGIEVWIIKMNHLVIILIENRVNGKLV